MAQFQQFWCQILRKETRQSGGTLTINIVPLNSPDSPPGLWYGVRQAKQSLPVSAMTASNQPHRMPEHQHVMSSEKRNKNTIMCKAEVWLHTSYVRIQFPHAYAHMSHFDRVTPVEWIARCSWAQSFLVYGLGVFLEPLYPVSGWTVYTHTLMHTHWGWSPAAGRSTPGSGPFLWVQDSWGVIPLTSVSMNPNLTDSSMPKHKEQFPGSS